MPRGRIQVMNDRQYRLVNEYFLHEGNRGEALRAAGYADTTSKTMTDRIFNHPLVVDAIKKRRAAISKKVELTQEWVIEQFMSLATAGIRLTKFKKVAEDGTLYWDFTGATEKELEAVYLIGMEMYTEGRGEFAREVKKFKINDMDPVNALQALARIQGMFSDRLKIEGDDEVVKLLQEGRRRVKFDEADK